MNKQEEFRNRALAKLLSERGVAADYEQRGARKKMDVVAEVDGLRIVLEAETGFHRKAQAIKDSDARLRQKLLATVRKEASALLSQDPHLERPEHRLIREALESQWPELVGEVS